MSEDFVSDHPEGATLRVRVSARSSRSGLDVLHGDAVRLRVQAPPVDGRANDEVREVIAELLRVARSDVCIVRGLRSRDKVVLVRGVPAGVLRAAIADVLTTP